MNNNPYLQYRHSEGLGDLIACTLHSKLISPITKFITGSREMCISCDKRRQALNFIFPIPFWRIFFKNYEEKLKDFQLYFEFEEKQEDINIQDDSVIEQPILEEKNLEIPKYEIVNESTSEIDDYIFKTIIYKKK
jgi:hypothetical protein